MTASLTRTQTNSFTDARLRAVMPEVGADFYTMAAADIITFDVARSWVEELTFVLQHQAARGFQIQLTAPGLDPVAVDYRVSNDGSLLESGTAGGINYYSLPEGTRARLFVALNDSAPNIATVREHLGRRGWGFDGHPVGGDGVRDRAYSKDGYGVIRSKIGAWP